MSKPSIIPKNLLKKRPSIKDVFKTEKETEASERSPGTESTFVDISCVHIDVRNFSYLSTRLLDRIKNKMKMPKEKEPQSISKRKETTRAVAWTKRAPLENKNTTRLQGPKQAGEFRAPAIAVLILARLHTQSINGPVCYSWENQVSET